MALERFEDSALAEARLQIMMEAQRHQQPNDVQSLWTNGGKSKMLGLDCYDDDAEEDAFIVEDDGDHATVELPAQFSRHSHQDLSMHFKVVCMCCTDVCISVLP